MAIICIKVLFFLLLYMNLLKFNEAQDGDCGPCVVEECPPIPKGCSSDLILDRCGCCQVCKKVRDLDPQEDFVPPQQRSAAKYLIGSPNVGKTETTLNSELSPVTLSPFRSLADDTFNENDRAHFYSSEFTGRLEKPFVRRIHYRPIVLHFSGNPIFSLMKDIIRRNSHYKNFKMKKPWRGCGLYRRLVMSPIHITEIHRTGYDKPVGIEPQQQKGHNEDSRNVVRVTRFRIIPIRIFFKRLRGTPTTSYSVSHPEVILNSYGHPYINPIAHIRTYGFNYPTRIMQPFYLNDQYRMGSRPVDRSRFYNILKNMMRLILLARLRQQQQERVPHIVTQSYKKEINDYDKYYFPLKSFNIKKSYQPKIDYLEFMQKKKPKRDGTFVDNSNFGHKQIVENVVDLHTPSKDKYFEYPWESKFFRKRWTLSQNEKAKFKMDAWKKINLENEKKRKFPLNNLKEFKTHEDIINIPKEKSTMIKNKFDKMPLNLRKLVDSLKQTIDKQIKQHSSDLIKLHVRRQEKENVAPKTFDFWKYSKLEDMDEQYGPSKLKRFYPTKGVQSFDYQDQYSYPFKRYNPFGNTERISDSRILGNEESPNINKSQYWQPSGNTEERVKRLALEANLKAQKILKNLMKNPTKTLWKVMQIFREYIRKMQDVSISNKTDQRR